jgi:hypothetical protein
LLGRIRAGLMMLHFRSREGIDDFARDPV